MAQATQSLRRSTSDCLIGGVCGGLAKYFGLDPTWVRIGYVLVSIFSGAFPGLLVYIVMLFIVPRDNKL